MIACIQGIKNIYIMSNIKIKLNRIWLLVYWSI